MKCSYGVRLGAILVILATPVCLSGCRDDGQLRRYPVTGTVKRPDGTPLPDLTVVFRSVEHDHRARARTLVDGSYRLSTFERHDGAVAGRHQVMVVPYFNADGSPGVAIARKYQQFPTSGLEFEVLPDGKNVFDLTVESR